MGMDLRGDAPLPADFVLPTWIKVDAHLRYLSRSSRKTMEVIVEMVNSAKGEVEITFAEHRNTWKVIPFSMIAGTESPLLGPWVASDAFLGSSGSGDKDAAQV